MAQNLARIWPRLAGLFRVRSTAELLSFRRSPCVGAITADSDSQYWLGVVHQSHVQLNSPSCQGKTGEDEVILDLSPLRTPQHFAVVLKMAQAKARILPRLAHLMC